MRLIFGNNNTGKFSKMMEVYYVYPSGTEDYIIYVVDYTGRYYSISFPDRKQMVTALSELRTLGYTTTYCDLEYVQETNQSTQEREIDPYNDYLEDLDMEIDR